MNQTVKAANLHAIGDIRTDLLPMPVCEEDEVLVRVAYCGVCGSDVPRVFEKGTYHFPTVIGHEFSGVVAEDKTGEWTGKRVAVFPLLPCRRCEACRNEQYALCADYDYYGSRRDGGMSEYLAVKRWNLLELPEGVSLEAGAMCEPSAVAHHAVDKLGEIEGKTLLISGAGPIGLLAAMWATHRGAAGVYFFDLDRRKLDAAEAMGFHTYTDGMPMDLCIEGTGAGGALVRCLAAMKPFGKMVLMGNPSGDLHLTQKDYWMILRKELRLMGTWNSSFGELCNDWREALKGMQEGIIEPERLITHRFDLTDHLKALTMMRDRSEFYQKVLLAVCPETNEQK